MRLCRESPHSRQSASLPLRFQIRVSENILVHAPISEEQLSSLESLCRAATPGPWKSSIEGRDHESGSDFIRTPIGGIELSGASPFDQDFIAAARSCVPSLVAEIRTLRRIVESRDSHS